MVGFPLGLGSRSVPSRAIMQVPGEALRMGNGYPVRLLLPGYEGNMLVKWLRRLELNAEPTMTRNETAKYTDPLPNGTSRQFSFVMDAKSIITSPAYPEKLTGPGWWQVTGLAWSGRGRIRTVQVSVDSGVHWFDAKLQERTLDKALNRFRFEWTWDGKPAQIASRCQDETGYWQPTRDEIITARGMSAGPDGYNHYNGIKWWRVKQNGEITNA